jgi:hypothetical protein
MITPLNNAIAIIKNGISQNAHCMTFLAKRLKTRYESFRAKTGRN